MRSNPTVSVSAALILGLASFTSAHATECRFDRNLTVSTSPVLAISTGSGDVRVTGSADGQIHIHGRVRGNNNMGWLGGSRNVDIQAVCNKPPIEQSASDVRIGKEHDEMYRHVSIDYDVQTPQGTDLNASTGSGNLDLSELAGHVVGDTGSGDIRAGNLPADTKLETGSGNITAHGLAGGSKLNTGSGDIHLQQSAPGDVRANTGSGNIEAAGLDGGLVAGTGSGWIHADGTPSSNWKLETGSGDVRLRLAGGKGYELDVESSSGDIRVDQQITMQGSLNKHHVRGKVAGGGAMIRVSTGSGDIEIR